MCWTCGGGRRAASAPAQKWVVTYPAGHSPATETKQTEIAAKLAASRVPGATYAAQAAAPAQ